MVILLALSSPSSSVSDAFLPNSDVYHVTRRRSCKESFKMPRTNASSPPSTATSDVGKEFCENPKVRKLSFTGSTEVGRILLRQAADQVMKCSMELGGNAPFIVFDDADPVHAAKGASLGLWGRLS